MFSGKFKSVGSRDLSFFFTLRIWRQSFLLTNLTIVPNLFLQAMTGLNIPFVKTPRTVSSRTLLSIEFVMPTVSRVSRREYWAFSQHCLSILKTLSTSLSLTVLTIAISASNFFKWVRVSLISLDRSVLC